jgi:hypothetical protein
MRYQWQKGTFTLETAVNAKTPRGKDATGREMGKRRQA